MRVAFFMVLNGKAKAVLALFLAIGALLTVWVSTAAAFRAVSYHKGDKLGGYTTLVAKHQGKLILGLEMNERGGSYRLCVEDPDDKKVCHRLGLKYAPEYGTYLSFLFWAHRFPVTGKGNYKATWYKGGERLGRSLRLSKS